MKKQDIYVVLVAIVLLLPFFISDSVYGFYETFNREHGMVMSFIKFAALATFGEAIGLRIRTGHYNHVGFGLLPRAVVWGFIGLTIKLAFVIFAVGTPAFLSFMGFTDAPSMMKGALSISKVEVAFAISAAMNIIYAPVMMTFHKITDSHISANGGRLTSLLKPIQMGSIMQDINWKVQWNFVFKKTIPFFWIPAHTITFLLPAEMQVLFAALLSVALGILLSIASLKSGK